MVRLEENPLRLDLDKRIKDLRAQRDAGEHRRLRAQIVVDALPIADKVARRYRDRSEPLEDLTQVARVGLIKAVDRFDPWRGRPFAAFAVPTIAGEVKRYFRDKGWAVRPPRGLQEIILKLRPTRDRLEQERGGSVSAADLAAEMGVGIADVRQALHADGCFRLELLPQSGDEHPHAKNEEALGVWDPALAAAEARETVAELVRDEAYEYRRVLYLRYFLDLTQVQISREVGVSQMQVSRMLCQMLDHMRQRAVAYNT